jgi:aryl-alcohol dehydrogenase-like predicted oxidoreductase
MVWDDHGRVSRVARPDTIRREVEASLRRLRVERIDLYQVHQTPAGRTPVEEYWQTMADLKEEGKVRAIGLSNHSVGRLDAAERVAHVAERHGVTQAAVAVAWTLTWPGVTGAIVGARSPYQVDGWLPAASLELTSEDRHDIADAIRRTGAGRGPATA